MNFRKGERIIVLFSDCPSCHTVCSDMKEILDIEQVSTNLPVIYGILKSDISYKELINKYCSIIDVMPDDSVCLCDCDFGSVHFDKKYQDNWATGQIKCMMGGLNSGFTGRGVIVGILDTGIDNTHPQIQDKVMYEAQSNNGDVNDKVGHGTAVASIIAGSELKTKWGIMSGLAPNVRIVNIKVFDDRGDGSFATFIRGLDMAISYGCDIINYSGGGTASAGNAIQDVLVDAISEQLNIAVVCPSGNQDNRVQSPGSSNLSVCVGGMNMNFDKSNFSNFMTIDKRLKPDCISYAGDDSGQGLICATTTFSGHQYAAIKGTSFSAPFITGMLALVTECVGRRLTRDEIEHILSESGNFRKKSLKFGYGLPDIGRAIEVASQLRDDLMLIG